MFNTKVKCVHCRKRISPNQDYCPKCGQDIREMWQSKSTKEQIPKENLLYCPNPLCHSKYMEGSLFCLQCGNDFTKNPPINSQISKQKPVYYCSICKVKRVNGPGKICRKCRDKRSSAPKDYPNMGLLCTITVLVIIGGIVAGVACYNTPPSFWGSNHTNSAVGTENEETNAEINSATESTANEDDEREKIDQYCELLENQVELYALSEVEYEEIVRKYEDFMLNYKDDLDNSISNYISKQIKMVYQIHESRELFEKAESEFSNREYEAAEENYNAVIEEDKKDYSLAQKQLSIMSETKVSYLNEADRLKNANKYDESLTKLKEGLSYFGYDTSFAKQYIDAIVFCVCDQSDYLMDKGLYFSSDGTLSAFDLIQSYLKQERYSSNDLLKEKLEEVLTKSEESEIDYIVKTINLSSRSQLFDDLAKTAARDNFDNSVIHDGNDLFNLCRYETQTQELINTLPDTNEIGVEIIVGSSMTASDFVSQYKAQLSRYMNEYCEYSGVGRYYDKNNEIFNWAILIIY